MQSLESMLTDTIVVAGRVNYRDETKLANGGAAGGYVGSMQTGTITNGQAYQAKTIKGFDAPAVLQEK